MPNWVCAGFNVSGDRAELKRFRHMMFKRVAKVGSAAFSDFSSLSQSYPGPRGETKLIFDFNGIIPMPPQSDRFNPEAWAVEHWGTKWNAQEVGSNFRDKDNVWFQFMTPWDFPTQVFEALAEEFPKLVFAGSAYEESGEFELVGQFNGDNDWGPGEIQWLDCGDGEDEEEEEEDAESNP